MLPSRPTTPLGRTLLFSTSCGPSAEADDGQVLLHWPSQSATPKASPILPQVNYNQANSSYFLSLLGIRKFEISKRLIWLPSFSTQLRFMAQPSYISTLDGHACGLADLCRT